jgi:hypothetical protein
LEFSLSNSKINEENKEEKKENEEEKKDVEIIDNFLVTKTIYSDNTYKFIARSLQINIKEKKFDLKTINEFDDKR